jgi:hypothetical protein
LNFEIAEASITPIREIILGKIHLEIWQTETREACGRVHVNNGGPIDVNIYSSQFI